MTASPPTADGTISKPLGIVIDTDNILIQPLRGIENETFGGGESQAGLTTTIPVSSTSGLQTLHFEMGLLTKVT